MKAVVPSSATASVEYSKPASAILPVAPENEPRRVAPPELISSVPPVTTLAVACGVGEVQLIVILATQIFLSAVALFQTSLIVPVVMLAKVNV